MTANPIELIGGLTNSDDVPKADIVSWAKARVPQVLANNAEIRSTILHLQQVVFVKSPGISWYLDAADSTSADDNVTCVISLDGKRFKPLSSVPFPTTVTLGGLYSSAAVTNQFVTGLGTDGNFTRAQPSASNLSDGVTGTGAVVRANSPALITPTGIVKGDVGLGNVDNTSDTTKWAAVATLTNKVINAVSNTISNLATSMFAANVVDTDTTLAANSDTRLASQKAVKAYVDALLNANDAMQFKGVIDCSANPNYPAASAGWTYRVSVAGKIGGASGVNVEQGDQLLCITDGTSSGNQAAVGANWSITQSNIDGAVVGPTSVTDDLPVIFDGTTGKLIKSKTYAAFKTLLVLVKGDVGLGNVDNTSDATKNAAAVTLTNKTITAPAIAGGTADALTSLGIRSTGAAFDVKMASAEVLTATRTVTWSLGNANRSITLAADINLTAAGAAILDDADAAAQRTTLSAAARSQTTEFISGYIKAPANQDYRLVVKIPHGGTITETVTRSESGTCTATFKVNTTALGGTANSVSSTEQAQVQASSNTFIADDDIVVTISSNSSCVGMSFTIKYSRTLL